MKTVPILFAFDRRFEMPAIVCFTSLLENASKDTFYDIFILHGDESDFSGSALLKLPDIYGNCRLTFRNVQGAFSGAYEVRGITEAAYYRLIAPEIIPEYDKILYSDVDVIFREDLAKYYDIDLKDNYFAAVDNCGVLRQEVRSYVSGLGLDYRKGYFYDGNLIINSKQILADGKTAEFRELGKKKFNQQDMDIMNIACNGRILSLPPAYCLSVLIYDLIVSRRTDMLTLFSEEELDHALKYGIVHYNGAKPWKEPCINMDIWWSYYRKSICFDEAWTNSFWKKQANLLGSLPLSRRIKLLVAFFIEKIKRNK